MGKRTLKFVVLAISFVSIIVILIWLIYFSLQKRIPITVSETFPIASPINDKNGLEEKQESEIINSPFFSTPIDTNILDTLSITKDEFEELKSKYYNPTEYYPNHDTTEHDLMVRCKNGKTFKFHDLGIKSAYLNHPIMKLSNLNYKVIMETSTSASQTYWYVINLNNGSKLELKGEPYFNKSYSKIILTQYPYTDGSIKGLEILENRDSVFKVIYTDSLTDYARLNSLFWINENTFVALANWEKSIKVKIKH